MTSDELEKFEKITYIPLEERPLTWWEYFFGKNEPEIEADPKSKNAKYRVTEQLKQSVNHKLIKKHQDDTPFPHTQSLVKTEDKSNELPSPYQFAYQPPTLGPQIPVKKLHPSIQQLRKRKIKEIKGIKDDLDI
jgi:hypothetical protein